MKTRRALALGMVAVLASLPAAFLSAIDIPQSDIGAAVIETYDAKTSESRLNLRIFDFGESSKIKQRDYPASFFPFALKGYYQQPKIWQRGRLILMTGAIEGSEDLRLYVYSVDASLGLRLASSIESMPAEPVRGANRRGEGGEARPVVSFFGEQLVIRGVARETRKNAWGDNYLFSRETVMRYSLDKAGKIQLVESRASDDGKELTQALYDEGFRFSGTASGLWEALELCGYDWKRADPIVKRMERTLAAYFDAQVPARYRVVGNKLALSFQLRSYIYDIASDEIVEAPSTSIYAEPGALSLGTTLILPLGTGKARTFDIADPAHPRALKTQDCALTPVGDKGYDASITRNGDVISQISVASGAAVVSRWRLGPDGSLTVLK